MAKGKMMPHPLACNACENKFVRDVWHYPIENADGSVLDWSARQISGDEGIKCPACGDGRVRLDR